MVVHLGRASYQGEQVSYLAAGSYLVEDAEDPALLSDLDSDLKGDIAPLEVEQVVAVCFDFLVVP